MWTQGTRPKRAKQVECSTAVVRRCEVPLYSDRTLECSEQELIRLHLDLTVAVTLIRRQRHRHHVAMRHHRPMILTVIVTCILLIIFFSSLIINPEDGLHTRDSGRRRRPKKPRSPPIGVPEFRIILTTGTQLLMVFGVSFHD